MPQGFQGLEIPGQFGLPGKPVCSGILQVDKGSAEPGCKAGPGNRKSWWAQRATLRRQLCPCSIRKLRKGLGI